MNTTQAARVGNKDRLATTIVADFFGAGGGKLFSTYCGAAVKATGSNPSYFLAGVPIKSFAAWDTTSGVALRTGVASTIKLLCRGCASYKQAGQKVVLVNGWLVSDSHQSPEDSIVQQVFDDRHIMASYFTCFGKMCYDPARSLHYFVSNPNDPMLFNLNGWGDCLDTPYGPRFAPGYRYGHVANGAEDPSTEPDPGAATTQTRKWRVSDILLYLRQMFYDVSKRPPLVEDFGLTELPRQFLDWPATLGSMIVENKCPQGFRLEGKDLLGALCMTLNYAGPYELRLNPLDEMRSRLEVVDFSPRANKGVKIYGPDYFGNDLDAVAGNPQVAAEFNVKRSALGYAHNTALTGDAAAIEAMASTDATDTDALALGLLPAWDATEAARHAAVVTLAPVPKGVDASLRGDATYFGFASKEYPSVYSWFKFNHDKNPFALSKYALRDESGNFRIKPHQLTSYNGMPQSTLGIVPREIVIEIKLTDYEYAVLQVAYYGIHNTLSGCPPQWVVASRYSDLALSPCGRYIQIPALRDLGPSGVGTWTVEHIEPIIPEEGSPPLPPFPKAMHYKNEVHGMALAGVPYAANYIVRRQVRIQLVCESDHAIVSLQGRNSDPNRTAPHIDSGAPPFTLLLRKPPLQYVDWLRSHWSRPVGAAYDLTIRNKTRMEFQPAQAAGKELFTDHIGDDDLTNAKNRLDINNATMLSNHKRICYEGTYTIKMLTPIYDVGMLVTFEAPNSLPDVTGVVKCVIFDSHGQSTRIEIGPPAFSTLWNGPLSAIFYGTNGTSAPPDVAAKDKYDQPYQEMTPPATPADTSPNALPADAAKQAGAAGAAAKPLGQRENRMKNLEQAKAKGDEKAGTMLDAMKRQTDKRSTEPDFGSALIGKASQGSMQHASGLEVKAGDLAPLGKASQGSMTFASPRKNKSGQSVAGRTVQAGKLQGRDMFDARAADRYDQENQVRIRREENKRDRASIDKFSGSQWGGKPGVSTPEGGYRSKPGPSTDRGQEGRDTRGAAPLGASQGSPQGHPDNEEDRRGMQRDAEAKARRQGPQEE